MQSGKLYKKEMVFRFLNKEINKKWKKYFWNLSKCKKPQFYNKK